MEELHGDITLLKVGSENTSNNFTGVEKVVQEVEDVRAHGLENENLAENFSQKEVETNCDQIIQNYPIIHDMDQDGNSAQDWIKKAAEIECDQMVEDDSIFEQQRSDDYQNHEMKQAMDQENIGILAEIQAQNLIKKCTDIKNDHMIQNDLNSEQPESKASQNQEVYQEMDQEVEDVKAIGLAIENSAKDLVKKVAEIESDQMTPDNQISEDLRTESSSNKDTRKLETEIGYVQIHNSQSSSSCTQKIWNKYKYELLNLSSDDQMFKTMYAELDNNMVDRKIKMIQCVKCEEQEKIFMDEANQLQKKYGDGFDLKIQNLYYGSTGARDENFSFEQDQLMATDGMFGRGIYFSENIKKCVNYLTGPKENVIFLYSVILGDTKEYDDGMIDPELKQAPEKEDGELYNSVKGNVDGFNEYVIYENRRCLMKYRIVLKDTKDEDSSINLIGTGRLSSVFNHFHTAWGFCKPFIIMGLNLWYNIFYYWKVDERLRNNQEVEEKHHIDGEDAEEKGRELKIDTGCEEMNALQDTLPASMSSVSQETLSEFMELTDCTDEELAIMIIENQCGSLDGAVNEYMSM